MIDQFVIFDPSGTVQFNYQPQKNYSKVINNFINDVLINERKMRFVEGSEMNNSKDKKAENEANEAAEEEVKNALTTEDIDSDESDEDEDDDDENQHEKNRKKDSVEKEEIAKYLDSDITLGSYTFESHNIKYLVWNNEEIHKKIYFTMVYPSLITIKKPYEFLKNVKILFENTPDINKFNKFFNLKLNDISTIEKKVSEPVKESVKKEIGSKVKNKKDSKNNKKSRKWNADGSYHESNEDESNLDFSASSDSKINKEQTSSNLKQLIGDQSTFGTKTSDGFLVSDLSDEMNKIIISSKKKTIAKEKSNSKEGAFSFLKKYIGGKKITKEDVENIRSIMEQHLIKKNVSPNVANSLMSEVEKDLIGQTTESFTSIEDTAKKSLAKQLKKLLTADSSIDLLHEIQQKKKQGKGPYSISVVGVNGVGKSTNLSKLAFWLLQNDYRVLVAACDTFRSGAVEQLRTHVNNLVQLSPNKKQIELFESGYGGADLVAKIATGAIKYAKENDYDVVLMDTAGRRHNDSHLMAPLASFAKAANPDKIIMVGEALVGTDSVLQAQNFNKAFGANRHLDFFIISKCDTVGNLIGSMVNMVFATGIPILFVGTGQTYTDLRTLSVTWAVDMLMA